MMEETTIDRCGPVEWAATRNMQVALIRAATPVAMPPGGYPAGPSPGIVGQSQDGAPRYGSEPDRGIDLGTRSAASAAKASDDRNDGTAALDANKGQDRK